MFVRVIIILYLSSVVCSLWAVPPTQALLAEVSTSEGKFSITLDYNDARRTVSHFVRLVNGTQPWMDEAKGKVQYERPYYTNLKFSSHVDQLNSNFKHIKVGTRPGVGGALDQTGPGYVLRDEIRRNVFGQMLIPHVPFTVTMASDGPHSGGSQFIINMGVGTEFDGRNSAFGIVDNLFYHFDEDGVLIQIPPHNGRAVATAIYNKGLLNQHVSIDGIRIIRVGNLAKSFDENAEIGELPLMGPAAINSIVHTPATAQLTHFSLAGGHYRTYASADLETWAFAPSFDVYYGPGVGPESVIVANHGGLPKAFFRLVSTFYTVTTVPANLLGKHIRISLGLPYANPATTVAQLNIGQFGITNDYYTPVGGILTYEGPFTYTFKAMGPYVGEIVVSREGQQDITYLLYFGGSNQDVSETEEMRAEIIKIGDLIQDPPIEAHFEYVP